MQSDLVTYFLEFMRKALGISSYKQQRPLFEGHFASQEGAAERGQFLLLLLRPYSGLKPVIISPLPPMQTGTAADWNCIKAPSFPWE